MSDNDVDIDHWTAVAADWIKWVRTPGHDAFWAYREAFLEFVGPGKGDALEIGCGEGRISREIRGLGFCMTATDGVAPMLAAAREANSADHYYLAPASDLPLADNSFDLVVAYNMLMDVSDMGAVLAEARRVLRPDGTLIISVVHPMADIGTFDTTAEGEVYRAVETYFGRKRLDERVERDGLSMHFAGWAQPIEAYFGELERAGFVITSLREPRPQLGTGWSVEGRFSRLPLFLWLKARPSAD